MAVGRGRRDNSHAVRGFPMIHDVALAGVERIAQSLRTRLADGSGNALEAVRALDRLRAGVDREHAEGVHLWPSRSNWCSPRNFRFPLGFYYGEPYIYAMRTGMTTPGCLVCALASLWAVANGRAVAAEKPYAGIAQRNVFDLKPPAPTLIQEDIKPPPPKLLLTGIATTARLKLALMELTVPGGKPGAKIGQVPLTLAVGQKAAGVEVLEIHEDEPKWVMLNNHDTIMKLNFTDNGVKPTSTASPATVGPQVNFRQPPPQSTSARKWPPETPMSPEQSTIMEAAYRMKYQAEIQAGTMPPMPGDNPLIGNSNNQPQ